MPSPREAAAILQCSAYSSTVKFGDRPVVDPGRASGAANQGGRQRWVSFSVRLAHGIPGLLRVYPPPPKKARRPLAYPTPVHAPKDSDGRTMLHMRERTVEVYKYKYTRTRMTTYLY